jgi:hypothetical protein
MAVVLGAIDAAAADRFQKLTGSQIRAKLLGMEMSDDVHWRDFYEPNGTFTSQSMGRKRVGKWWVEKNELCVDRGKDDGGCYEVWISGKKIQLKRPGLDFPFLEGALQNPIKRD